MEKGVIAQVNSMVKTQCCPSVKLVVKVMDHDPKVTNITEPMSDGDPVPGL
jgi:hypothetical protein